MSVDVDLSGLGVLNPWALNLALGNLLGQEVTGFVLDFGLDTVSATLKGDANNPITAKVIGDANSPVTAKLIGDANNPVTAKVIGDVNNPVTAKLIGDTSNPVSLALFGDVDKPVSLALFGDPDRPLSLLLAGDPDKPITLDLGLDDVNIDLGLDDVNISLCVGITQIPSIRVQMPTSSCVGFSLLGIPIFNLSFESQWGLTTQDNPPRIIQGPPPPDGDTRAAGPFENDVTVRLGPEV